MRINVVTIFPDFFEAPLETSIPGRAEKAGVVRYRVVDLRDYTHDRHRTVDDEPYGGGAGMVMKPEPFFEAIDALAPAEEQERANRWSDADHVGRRSVPMTRSLRSRMSNAHSIDQRPKIGN